MLQLNPITRIGGRVLVTGQGCLPGSIPGMDYLELGAGEPVMLVYETPTEYGLLTELLRGIRAGGTHSPSGTNLVIDEELVAAQNPDSLVIALAPMAEDYLQEGYEACVWQTSDDNNGRVAGVWVDEPFECRITALSLH